MSARSIREPRVDLVDDADRRAITLLGRFAARSADDLVEEGIANRHERPVSHRLATHNSRPWSPGAPAQSHGAKRAAKTTICLGHGRAAARMMGLGITLL